MTTWQDYVKNNLVGTGKMSYAAIIGIQDKAIWAQSSGITLTPDEINKIVEAFDPANKPKVQEGGLVLCGTKYFAIAIGEEGDDIQLKNGQNGACLARTIRAIILAAYESPIQHPECASIVLSLAQYLKEQTY